MGLKQFFGVSDRPQHNELGCPHVNDEAFERLTDEVANKVIERLENKLYLRIGRGVVHKVLWLIGLCTVSVAAWMHSKGLI